MTIANCYREILSDYGKDKQAGGKKYKGIYKKGYSNKAILGEKMNLDEKYVHNEYVTILSNSDKSIKNKIASIVKGVNPTNTIKKLKSFFTLEERNKVKEVAVDMSNGMIKVVREVFKKALIVIDRFHVRNLVNEMIGAVKTQLKVKLSRQIATKTKEQKKKSKDYKQKRYSNDETVLEMLTRSHYQIRKNKKNWTNKEITRWKIMEKIPYFKSIVSIYEVSSGLYDIYEQKIEKEEAIVLMKEWMKRARRYRRIPQLLHLADTVEKRLDHITNYFVSRHTNGYGEGLNSRIGHILRDSRGFVNNDYMIFRLTTAL